jgi:O-antigen ligase
MKTFFAFIGIVLPGLGLTWLFINGSLGIYQFLLFIILLAVVPVFFLKPEYGLILLIIARNIIDVFDRQAIVTFGGIDLNLASLLGILLLPWAGFVIISSLRRSGISKWKQFFQIPLTRLWSVIIVLALIGLPFSFEFTLTIKDFIKMLDFFALYITSYLLATQIQLKRSLQTLVGALIVPGLFGLFQFFVLNGGSANLASRLRGNFVHPNAFAFSLIVGLASLAMLYAMTTSIKEKCWYVLLSFVYFFLLVFTFTRSAWVAIALVAVGVLWIYARKLLIPLILSVVMIVFSFPLISNHSSDVYNINLYENPLIQRLQPETNEADGSFLWRQRIWRETFPAFFNKPIFGYGIGTFPGVRRPLVSFESDLTGLEAHNDYLRILIELGLVGLILYVSIFSNILWRSWKSLKSAGKAKPVLLIYTFFIAAVMVISFSDNIIRNVPTQWMFWFLTGAVLAYIKYELPSRSN